MSEHDNGPESYDDISSRFDKVLRDQELMAVTQAEAETEQQKKRQRAELADHRTGLLKAVKVEVPDLAAPLFEKLSALADENHEFAPREVVDLLRAHKTRFKDEPDFFDLGIAQREDLLDRVGFYRGVVIDHSLSNPVEAGFRDVLMRADARDEGAGPEDVPSVRPAHLLYRKPNFSGYFENDYTTSNSIFQTQKNGVTNLSFSLGVAAGKFGNSVALGASLTKYGRQEESSSFVGKTVYTTANFYLPKIELSFDNTQACASRAFFDACERAVAASAAADPAVSDASAVEPAVNDPEERRRFEKLKKVLDDFGHFVPLQTLVGGRLFATEKKLFEGSEKSSDFTDRFGIGVKASLSTVYVDVEASGSYENSKQEATRTKSSSEMQTMTFNAIGGEGTVVQDAAAWAESLYDYRRWASVQRENLIPSINLLPEDLRDKCWQVLTRFSDGLTKRDLLSVYKAFFLFYGEYGERVGRKAREVYFSIQNHAHDAAIAVNTVLPSEGVEAVLVEPETVSSQLWRMTENGQIVLRTPGRKTAHGKTDNIYFALTADLSAAADGTSQDVYPVSLCQLSDMASQVWDYPGSGELTCRALGNDYVLEAVTDKLLLRKRALAGRQSHLWYLAEIPLYIEKTLTDGNGDRLVQITIGEGDAVLSVANVEHLSEINTTGPFSVIAQPNTRGSHQFWLQENSGRFVSAMKTTINDQSLPLLLSADDATGSIFASPFKPSLIQKWSVTTAGELEPATAEAAKRVLSCSVRDGLSVSGSSLELRERNAKYAQKLRLRNVDTLPEGAKRLKQVSCKNVQEICDVNFIDKTPLVIEGKLSGIEFFLEKVSDSWGVKKYALRMIVMCINEKGEEIAISHERGNNANLDETLVDNRKTFLEDNYLYFRLPTRSPYSLRLAASDCGQSLRAVRFEYQEEKNGKWYGFSNNGFSAGASVMNSCSLKVALAQATKADQEELIVAIGIDAKPDENNITQITPKILTRQGA